MKKLYVKISKFLSYILRHHPEKFNLGLDSEGFTDVQPIIEILNNKFNYLNDEITKETIIEIIKTSDKKRFELNENKIRAYYGHSLSKKIKMVEVVSLPPKLYHGTTFKAYNMIKVEGLNKRKRQYIHLSENVETAILVGKRKTKTPIILEIDTIAAQKEGIVFYKSGDMFLTDYIPPRFISIYTSNE